MESILKKFYKNKKILITGHSGFKGYWLTQSLLFFGAKIHGVSHKIYNKNNFKGINTKNFIETYKDLRKTNIEKLIKTFKPDIIFHLAAQSNLPLSYKEPFESFDININTTLNILEALRKIDNATTSIFITSDKAYKNLSFSRGYKESDELGGKDPYSSSKACSELIIQAYAHSYNLRIASARAGNVIGGNDFSNNRIFPDCMRYLHNKKKILIRNPNATRPWQHVLDVINGYLILGKYLYKNKKYTGSWNFGPNVDNNKTVKLLTQTILNKWGEGEILYIKNKVKEDKFLQLNSKKAHKYINWKVNYAFDKSVSITVDWYKDYFRNPKHTDLITSKQIKKYFV